MQRFVSDLVEQHNPAEVDPNPQHTIARLRAVMRALDLSETVEEFFTAQRAPLAR